MDRFVLSLVVGSFIAALAPLLSVLIFTIAHGAKRFDKRKEFRYGRARCITGRRDEPRPALE